MNGKTPSGMYVSIRRVDGLEHRIEAQADSIAALNEIIAELRARLMPASTPLDLVEVGQLATGRITEPASPFFFLDLRPDVEVTFEPIVEV